MKELRNLEKQIDDDESFGRGSEIIGRKVDYVDQ
jgi:hypothetical protein